MFDLPGASPALKALAERGTLHSHRKGRQLIVEGEFGDTIHIIVSGRLRVYSVNDTTGREVTYGSYGPGEYVGEMSLDGGPRSANVEVAEKASCITVTRATIEAFITERPEFAFELLAKVIRRARVATLSTKQLALNDVYGRLRAMLESLAVPAADGLRVVHEKLTHAGMADRCGCTRSMISRLMKDLERGEVVRRLPRSRWQLLRTMPRRW